MASRNRAAFERRLCRREERVTPHRDRRRSGVRGLAGEADHVPLDAKGPEHGAGGPLHRLEHRPLLDVQLEIGTGVDGLQFLPRVDHAIEQDAVLGQRIHQPGALAILQVSDVVERQAAGRRRRSEQAPAEARPFFVGPVHELQRDRRRLPRVRAQGFERGHDPERAVQPTAVRHRIQMRADDHGLLRGSCERDPVVAGGIGLDREAEGRDFFLEPDAGVAPHRTPREALRSVGRRRPRSQFAQFGDHPPGPGDGLRKHGDAQCSHPDMVRGLLAILPSSRFGCVR